MYLFYIWCVCAAIVGFLPGFFVYCKFKKLINKTNKSVEI